MAVSETTGSGDLFRARLDQIINMRHELVQLLRDRAEVHEVALSVASGRGTLYVPLSDQGVLLHLAGSLKRSHFQFRNIKTYDVEIRTLDEMGLAGVRFVKADVRAASAKCLTALEQPSRATGR